MRILKAFESETLKNIHNADVHSQVQEVVLLKRQVHILSSKLPKNLSGLISLSNFGVIKIHLPNTVVLLVTCLKRLEFRFQSDYKPKSIAGSCKSRVGNAVSTPFYNLIVEYGLRNLQKHFSEFSVEHYLPLRIWLNSGVIHCCTV